MISSKQTKNRAIWANFVNREQIEQCSPMKVRSRVPLPRMQQQIKRISAVSQSSTTNLPLFLPSTNLCKMLPYALAGVRNLIAVPLDFLRGTSRTRLTR